jgi:hypothetical protein
MPQSFHDPAVPSFVQLLQDASPAAHPARAASSDSGDQQQQSLQQQQSGGSPGGSHHATDTAVELTATAQLQKIRETSRKAQRRYRERQRVNCPARLPLSCVPGCHSIYVVYIVVVLFSPAGSIAQDKLVTAESKVAELTKQLEELRFEKARAVPALAHCPCDPDR